VKKKKQKKSIGAPFKKINRGGCFEKKNFFLKLTLSPRVPMPCVASVCFMAFIGLLFGAHCFKAVCSGFLVLGFHLFQCLLIGVSCSGHLLGFAFCGSAFMSFLYGVFLVFGYMGLFLVLPYFVWVIQVPFLFFCRSGCGGILRERRGWGVLKEAPPGFLSDGAVIRQLVSRCREVRTPSFLV
jgi:hypothetical protein